jgi:VWFA-related protein
MNRFLACFAVTMLFFGIAGIPAQDDALQTKPVEEPEAQKIKVQTELMEVRAVVTDRGGQIVENLTKDDFELLENDQPQEISFFSVSQIESKKSKPVAAEADGSDSTAEIKRVRDRLSEPPIRTTLLYVDSLHLSFSSLNRVKEAIRRFINKQLTEQDVVALATSSQTLGVGQQFTRDRQLLNYAVEQIRPGRTRFESFFTPALAADFLDERLDAVRLAVDVIRNEENIECPCSLLLARARIRAQQILSEDSYSRQNTLSVLRGFAERMIDLPGKRMIVVFSDGFTMRDSKGDIYDSEIQSVIARAVRSGVVIYSIDAKGLQAPVTIDASKNLFAAPPLSDNHPDQDMTYEDALKAAADAEAAGINVSDFLAGKACPGELVPDQRCLAPHQGLLTSTITLYESEKLNGLHAMAEDTGGKMFTNTNDLSGALGQAFDANRYYYVLSYYLPERSDNRGFRRIEVRVRNHPEYRVRTARGFALSDLTADAETDSIKTPQQQLFQAMREPMPVTDLGVSARADFLETDDDDKQVSLTVYFDGDRFQYREEDQRNVVELEVVYAIYDSSANQVEAISAHVEGSLSVDRLKQAITSGYRFSRRLTLKPGVYQVRVGVREEGTNRMGTATAWVDVPELSQEKLEMSSLILSNPLDIDFAEAEEGVDVSELEQIKMVQGIPLFECGDFFDYSFRVHLDTLTFLEPDLAWMPELYRGGELFKPGQWVPISFEKEDIDGKGWLDVYGEVDIGEIGSGVYELRVSVKDARSNKSIQRNTVFSVE